MDKVAVIFSEEATEKITNSNTGLFGYADDPPPIASGGSASQDTSFFDGASPSAAIDKAISGIEGLALELAVLLTFIGLALLIIFIYFYVALQIFVVTIDFYITVSITQLLVPFLVNKHTSPIATSAFNAVVAKSVKLGVLVMILGMFGNTVSGLQLDATPTLYELLALLLGVCTLAFMVAQSGQIAAGIFSAGGAGIDVGGAMMAASASLAQTAVSAASGGVSAAANQLSGGGGSEAVMAPLDPTGGAASGAGGVGDAADAIPGPAGQQEAAPASPESMAGGSEAPGAAGQQEAAQGPMPSEHPEVTTQDLSAGSSEGGSGE
jgi:type IV secretory pathway TrbL component